MAKVGVIKLGLDPNGDYLVKFLKNLKEVSGMDITEFDYRSLNPTEIADSGVDSLVLSPGDALVGLDTDERFIKDNKVKYISLEIHLENKAALKFYRKSGFKDYTIKLAKKI